MYHKLGKPETQKEYQLGLDDYFNNKAKEDNPFKDWLTKSSEIKRIYWDMGWERGNSLR